MSLTAPWCCRWPLALLAVLPLQLHGAAPRCHIIVSRYRPANCWLLLSASICAAAKSGREDVWPALQLTNWLNYSIGENARHCQRERERKRGRTKVIECKGGRAWPVRHYYRQRTRGRGSPDVAFVRAWLHVVSAAKSNALMHYIQPWLRVGAVPGCGPLTARGSSTLSSNFFAPPFAPHLGKYLTMLNGQLSNLNCLLCPNCWH